MFAIDTNLFVYAHNTDAPLHDKAKIFLERVLNSQDENGRPIVCVPVQVLIEFINVVT